jgi:hypothetical protein
MSGAKRLALVALCAVACGPVDLGPPTPPPMSNVPCVEDSDCAPNACCGRGDTIVHEDEAPDCSAVECDESCPVHGIMCGCAVPVCRESRCVAAVSSTPDCS